MYVSLIVIRSADMEALKSFYEQFGISWNYHRHGDSPLHYSAKIDKTLIEIYPLAKGQDSIDGHLRLGFAIDDFDNAVIRLKDAGINFVSDATETEFGISAIIKDPEERRVELYKIS